MTCIPISKINKLGSLEYNSVDVRDANDNLKTRNTYIVNITIGTYHFENLEVIAMPKDYALIGRDILNLKKTMFNANEEIWIYDCQGECRVFSDGVGD